MYEIKAYVRKVMVEYVVDRLASLPGVTGIAVVPLTEFGHFVGKDDRFLDKAMMAKLEVDVADQNMVDQVCQAIVVAGRTREGHPGDGRVLVSKLANAIRIDDGVSGADALRRRP